MKDTIRKTLVFLTALIAVLAMTGCGSKTTSTSPSMFR